MTDKKRVDVAIALVWRDLRLLISRRRQGEHLAGFWEFPGGKIEGGETPAAAAEREVLEEVGVVVHAEHERALITHEYADRVVCLHPVDCRFQSGEAKAIEVAEVRWVRPSELSSLKFPPANATLIAELSSHAQGSSGLR